MKGVGEFLVNIGILNGDHGVYDSLVSLALIGLAAFLCDILCRKVTLLVLHLHSKLRHNAEEESVQYKKLLSAIAAIIPAVLINVMLPMVLDDQSSLRIWIERFCSIYIVVMVALFITSLLDFVYSEYFRKRYTNLPINIVFQIVKYVVIIVTAIIAFSILLNKSPATLLTGVGASAAVLSLIYKDTLVGLVSGVQLMGNKMLSIGDWISVPKANADGIVREITLNTVKVQNWDNTTVTIPPSALLSDSFQNWRSMQESGARRISRSINIDMDTIRFCTNDEMKKYREITLLKDFFKGNPKGNNNNEEGKESKSVDSLVRREWDEVEGINRESPTNLTVFVAYLEAYMETVPTFIGRETHFVRQLQPTENGLPLEIYFFTSELRWEKYEKIQMEFLTHVIATMNYFGLSAVQRVSGKVEEK